jgi:cell division protein FtsL
MKKFFSNPKIKWKIFFVLVFIGLLYLFFNNFGVIKYMRLKKEVDSLTKQIEMIKAENKKLELEIDSLKNLIPEKIEQIAREKHNLIKPEEKKYNVIIE